MSDSDVTKPANFNKGKSKSSTGLNDQIGDAGAEMKQRAGEALQASTDMARDKISEATDAAKNVANGAVDQIQERRGSSSRPASIYRASGWQFPPGRRRIRN